MAKKKKKKKETEDGLLEDDEDIPNLIEQQKRLEEDPKAKAKQKKNISKFKEGLRDEVKDFMDGVENKDPKKITHGTYITIPTDQMTDHSDDKPYDGTKTCVLLPAADGTFKDITQEIKSRAEEFRKNLTEKEAKDFDFYLKGWNEPLVEFCEAVREEEEFKEKVQIIPSLDKENLIKQISINQRKIKEQNQQLQELLERYVSTKQQIDGIKNAEIHEDDKKEEVIDTLESLARKQLEEEPPKKDIKKMKNADLQNEYVISCVYEKHIEDLVFDLDKALDELENDSVFTILDMRRKAEESIKEGKSLQDEVYKSEIKEKDEKIEELEISNDKLEKKYKDIEQKNDSLSKGNDSLVDEKNKLLYENKALEEERKELTKENKAKSTYIANIKESMKEFLDSESELDENKLDEAAGVFVEKYLDNISKAKELSTELEEARSDYNEIKEEYDLIDGNLNSAKREIESANAEKNELEEKVEELEREKNSLESQMNQKIADAVKDATEDLYDEDALQERIDAKVSDATSRLFDEAQVQERIDDALAEEQANEEDDLLESRVGLENLTEGQIKWIIDQKKMMLSAEYEPIIERNIRYGGDEIKLDRILDGKEFDGNGDEIISFQNKAYHDLFSRWNALTYIFNRYGHYIDNQTIYNIAEEFSIKVNNRIKRNTTRILDRRRESEENGTEFNPDEEVELSYIDKRLYEETESFKKNYAEILSQHGTGIDPDALEGIERSIAGLEGKIDRFVDGADERARNIVNQALDTYSEEMIASIDAIKTSVRNVDQEIDGVKDFFEIYNQGLSQLADSQINRQEIENLISNALEDYDSQIKQNINNIQSNQNRLRTRLETLMNGVEGKTEEAIGKALELYNQEMSTSIDEINSGINENTQAIEQLNGIGPAVENLQTAQNTLSEKIANLVDGADERARNIVNQALDTYSEEVIRGMSTWIENSNQKIDQVKDSVENYNQILSQLADSQISREDIENMLNCVLEAHDSGIGLVFESLQESYSELNERLEAFMESDSERTAETVNNAFEQYSQQIRQLIRGVQQEINGVKADYNNMNYTVFHMKEEFRNSLENNTQAMQSLADGVLGYLDYYRRTGNAAGGQPSVLTHPIEGQTPQNTDERYAGQQNDNAEEHQEQEENDQDRSHYQGRDGGQEGRGREPPTGGDDQSGGDHEQPEEDRQSEGQIQEQDHNIIEQNQEIPESIEDVVEEDQQAADVPEVATQEDEQPVTQEGNNKKQKEYKPMGNWKKGIKGYRAAREDIRTLMDTLKIEVTMAYFNGLDPIISEKGRYDFKLINDKLDKVISAEYNEMKGLMEKYGVNTSNPAIVNSYMEGLLGFNMTSFVNDYLAKDAVNGFEKFRDEKLGSVRKKMSQYPVLLCLRKEDAEDVVEETKTEERIDPSKLEVSHMAQLVDIFDANGEITNQMLYDQPFSKVKRKKNKKAA
ncbi:hypothetical protein GF361_03625 [Candidatus Woesearchaeota archaeon]|nr:hypothetical protein [Candidatus Woesearchaeota archaeon]